MKPSDLKLTVREMVLFAILGAMTFAAKYVMSFLPNIEPSSLMVMLFAVTFGVKAIFPIYLYVLLEILFFGLGLWNINYLYIWAVLAVCAWLLRGMTLAIEPMVNAGGAAILQLSDGWTVKTRDGKNAAHYENTILITDGEPEILTAPAI